MRKHIIVKSMVVLLVLMLATLETSMAVEKATKEECIAKAKSAAALVKEVGVNAAMKKLSEKSDEFVWKDTYVFVADLAKGTVLAHPIKPGMVGKPLSGIKDINGKLFFAEFVSTAKSKGEGWVSYMWPKPGEKKPSSKVTYVYRVPGEDFFTAAGVYEN